MAGKELTVVGGANGTGKTTFAVEYASRRNCLYLAGRYRCGTPPGCSWTCAGGCRRGTHAALTAALSRDDTIVLESTLAGRTLRHVIGSARDNGFTITIVYLFLDSPDTCVEHVEERVQKGGHSVPAPMFGDDSFAASATSGGCTDRWRITGC